MTKRDRVAVVCVWGGGGGGGRAGGGRESSYIKIPQEEERVREAGWRGGILASFQPHIGSPEDKKEYNNTLLILKKEIQLSAFDK